ncbi:NAD-dependent epimerase/dehydratase family protein [Marinactinospora thermotolerans]|uniref:UDP-glucose 4-epimerase n=1 Tax=Marinactinospora thermotolerans DSM 45154 TaxID=1122192 RepID=A0A1T4N172_9ACTN|nr:NAD-dependent epimerase/dehydratase family protein [Marinactinospora thermotolerans]SJZ73043.1 UDP-glucose 4-epimerase [Marinactinospora thermotolerans DSM 45154]
MARVVLVTGVSRYLGARVANALQADPGVDRVIGVDSARPHPLLGGAEFVRADPHDGSVNAVVSDSGADTVLHLGLATAPRDTAGRPFRENNALGSLQVLAACQRSAKVDRLVVRSSAAVYGPSSCGPEVCTEEAEAQQVLRPGYAKDAVELERHVRGLVRRRPDISVAVLRFANLMGPSVETPLTRYLGLRIVPTLRGHDPRMQFLHEDDGVEALRRMATSDGEGTFNVAAPGAIPLSQCLRRAGRPEFPVPAGGLRVFDSLARRARLDYSPDHLRLLCSGRVLDSGKLERALEWSPSYSSQEAFDSFVAERVPSARTPTRLIGQMTHRVRGVVGR